LGLVARHREQPDWDARAGFMDTLAEEGFALLVGPVEGDREVIEIVEADSEEAVRTRLADDPWAKTGMLTPVGVERWTVTLGARRLS
jgi:uncharacterized protein YciI